MYDFAVALVYDSSFSYAVVGQGSSRIWLANSTSNHYYVWGQSEVFVSWYLDVHVVDSIGQDVPVANVTATYTNMTLADWQLTDSDGWARLILMEKMMNATGEYIVGNYVVESTYESHSNSKETGMITGNKQIAIQLPFIIPEFPSFLILPLFVIATLLAVIAYKRKHA